MITAKKSKLCRFCVLERQNGWYSPPPPGWAISTSKRPILHRGRWRNNLLTLIDLPNGVMHIYANILRLNRATLYTSKISKLHSVSQVPTFETPCYQRAAYINTKRRNQQQGCSIWGSCRRANRWSQSGSTLIQAIILRGLTWSQQSCATTELW